MSKKFTKHDAGKIRPDLLPPKYVEDIGAVLEHGAREYGPDNWKNCEDPQRYLAAGYRHFLRIQAGEWLDPDSGLPHVAHLGCCMAFYQYLMEKLTGVVVAPLTEEEKEYMTKKYSEDNRAEPNTGFDGSRGSGWLLKAK